MEAAEEDLDTESLLAKIRSESVGIWCLKTSTGHLPVSHAGPHPRTFRNTSKFQQDRSMDTELNAWYSAHHTAGLQACGGQCAGGPNHPQFYDVEAEGAATITPELRRVGCAGFCRKALARKRST